MKSDIAMLSSDALGFKIWDLESKLRDTKVNTKDYEDLINNLRDLYELKGERNKLVVPKEPKVKDWSPVITSMIGFAGILAILNYEKTDVIASKAMTIAQKMIGK
jgi:hypothetical protein